MPKGLKTLREVRNPASVCNTCIVTGLEALLTASKTDSNGSCEEMQKSKQSQTLNHDLKEQKGKKKTPRTNTHINSELKQRWIINGSYFWLQFTSWASLTPVLGTENCRYCRVCCISSQPPGFCSCSAERICLCTSWKLLRLVLAHFTSKS